MVQSIAVGRKIGGNESVRGTLASVGAPPVPPGLVAQLAATCGRLMDEVSKVIVGKREVLRNVVVNILSQGNILFEDYPGLAKTLMASTFARATGCEFKRVQFTPDVLPADITGSMLFDQKAGEFRFRQGPVFTNILLADEINRAPPKTQSALLEAMQERQVSIEGQTHKLSQPYVVMATQNPIEQEGTYNLPEAQMDRFLMKLGMGYPTRDDEVEIGARRIARKKDEVDVAQITGPKAILGMQQVCEMIHLDRAVLTYIADLVVATRSHPALRIGSSPRGTLALIKAARASAALEGRTFVTPDDVRRLAVPVLAHRIILRSEAQFEGRTGEAVILEVVNQVSAPTTNLAPS